MKRCLRSRRLVPCLFVSLALCLFSACADKPNDQVVPEESAPAAPQPDAEPIAEPVGEPRPVLVAKPRPKSAAPVLHPVAERPSDSPRFLARELKVEVARDYEQRAFVTVENPSDKPHKVQLSVTGRPADLILGFVGAGSEDLELELAPGSRAEVGLVVFAQDAEPGSNKCSLALRVVGAEPAVEDHVHLVVQVARPKFELAVETTEVDPLSLATTVRVRNRGEALSDLSVAGFGTMAARLSIDPQIRHARLAAGGLLAFTVSPRLKRGDRELEAELEFAAAGQSLRLPLRFSVPEGKQVFVAATHSALTNEAMSWFCTNRPDIQEDLRIGGNGPENGEPPDAPEGPEVIEGNSCGSKLRKLFVKDHHPAPVACSGVRGGTVRPAVAKQLPGLERNNVEGAYALVGASGQAVIWHRPEGIFFVAEGEGGPAPLKLSETQRAARWPTLAGDPAGVLIAAWEEADAGGRMEIALRRSSDGGRSWDAPQRMTAHGQGAFDPVLRAEGKLWQLAWEDGRGGISLRRSLDGGQSWSDAQRIAEGRAAWPVLAGQGSRLFCAFARDDRVHLTSSTDGGASWNEPEAVSPEGAAAGEPGLAWQGDRLFVAWRQDGEQGAPSAVWLKVRRGERWDDAQKLSHADSLYGEYPQLYAGSEGIVLAYFGTSLGHGFEFVRESADGGESWAPYERLARQAPNVQQAFLTVDFSLPWDLGRYRKHDVELQLNDRVIARIEDSVPEGRYFYPIEPGWLEHRRGSLATNRLSLNTRHLNGGHYVINSGFRLVQLLSHQERAVVAKSQAEADRLARRVFDATINHDRPDLGLFVNRIEGLPEDTQIEQDLSLKICVVNLGPVKAPGGQLAASWLEKGVERPAAEPVSLGETAPGACSPVTLSVHHDGRARVLRLRLRAEGPDADGRNNLADLRLGRHHEGELKLIESSASGPFRLRRAGGHEDLAELSVGVERTLPVGSYDLFGPGDEPLCRNLAVRGGELTLADPDDFGRLRVLTEKKLSLTLISDEKTLTGIRSNEVVRLKPGFYRIEAPKSSGLVFPELTVDRGSFQEVRGEQHGFIVVDLIAKNALIRVLDIHGDKVAEGFSRSRIPVPPGTYSLKTDNIYGGAPIPQREGVSVKGGATTRTDIEAGTLFVDFFAKQSNGLYVGTTVRSKDESIKASVLLGSKLLLPPGTYSVELLGQHYDDIEVTAHQAVTFKPTGLGSLVAYEYPDSWMHVFDAKGKQVAKTLRGINVVLPVGRYEVRIDKERIENVVVRENETTELRPSK